MRRERWTLLLVLLLQTCLLVQPYTKQKFRSADARRKAQRRMLIKCCGSTPCLEPPAKKHHPTLTTTLNASSTQPQSRSTSTTESPRTTLSSSVASTTLQQATERDAETEATTTSSPLAEESTRVVTEEQTTPTTTTETTSTSSTTTSTSSTTSTSTTTSPTTTTSATTTTASTIKTIAWKKPNGTLTTRKPQVQPTCPQGCQKDRTFFRPDGSLEDPEYHGFWESVCGELFVFGKTIVNWEQNVERCCRLGMTPISLTTPAKSECFDNFINGLSWKYNSRYWSSGLRSASSEFRWCDGGAAVDEALWLPNATNNLNSSENCAQIVISKRYSTARLDDKHCGLLSVFACQGPPTSKPSCASPTCMNLTCKMDYRDAMLACCSIKMKLISLHQDYKFRSLYTALDAANVQPDVFWTSGTDLGCEGVFGYCSKKRLLRKEALWDVNQPDNANGNENCLAVSVKQDAALLQDRNCDTPLRYVCEGKVASGAEVVENECGAAYNLTKEYIKDLMKRFPVTLNEKCFFKCFGEGTDMFINGRLVEERVMAQFSSVAAGDVDKLMDMYSTLNHCTNITRGMDDCDKAADLLRCGKENSPELLVAVMDSLENSIVEAPIVLPTNESICPTDYQCVVDDHHKILFDLAPSNSSIEIGNVVLGQVTHACGKKFLAIGFSTSILVNHKEGLEICCNFGLRLARVETAQKVACMVDAGVGWMHPAAQIFMVDASRLGNFERPRWCVSRNLVDLTIATDGLTPNQTPDHVNVMLDFTQPPRLFGWAQVRHVMCESTD